MQTFLPLADFDESARHLDRQRLGKQRVEVVQLLLALAGLRHGWRSHPACLMWERHAVQLAVYGQAICREWVRRGYRDTCSDTIAQLVSIDGWDLAQDRSEPWWLGEERLHSSHRGNLMRKAWDSNDEVLDWYLAFDWDDDDEQPYAWPLGEGTWHFTPARMQPHRKLQ